MRIRNFLTNSFLVILSSYIGLFICSSYFYIREKQSISNVRRAELKNISLAKKKKIKLIKEGYLPIYYPHFTKDKLTLNNNIYPLGSLPYTKTLLCDEGYGFIKYDSDRFGFRNKDYKWEVNTKRNIYIVGDSFAHGSCVEDKNTISENIEKFTKINTINLGMSSSDPYDYSAVLKNLVKPLLDQKKDNQSFVVLIFYTNDNRPINIKSEKILNNSVNILSEINNINQYPKPSNSYNEQLFELIKNNYPISKKEIIREMEINRMKETYISKNITLYMLRDKLRLKKNIKKFFKYLKSDNQLNLTKKINNNFSKKTITEKTIFRLSQICKDSCKPIVVYIPNSIYWRPSFTKSDDYKIEIKNQSENLNIKFIDAEKVINRNDINDYSPIGTHLSINGYLKLSDLIAEEINNF